MTVSDQDKLNKDINMLYENSEQELTQDLTDFMAQGGLLQEDDEKSEEISPEEAYQKRLKLCGGLTRKRVIRLRELLTFIWISHKETESEIMPMVKDINRIIFATRAELNPTVEDAK